MSPMRRIWSGVSVFREVRIAGQLGDVNEPGEAVVARTRKAWVFPEPRSERPALSVYVACSNRLSRFELGNTMGVSSQQAATE